MIWFWQRLPLFCLLLAVLSGGQTQAATCFGERYESLYIQNLSRYETDGATNPVTAWEFARACFDWAEFATNDTQRALIAEQGIDAARRAVRMNSNLAPAHYYLAMNLGQLARTKTLGALKLVSEMERVFLLSAALDSRFDHAGAERCLGLLYRDAPGWPASIGSRSKARVHLLRALELAPGYPDNQLNLLESWIEWGEKKTARAQLSSIRAIIEKARPLFTGEAWACSWKDWDTRLEKVSAQMKL